jgi:hypothetical protein
MIGRAGWRHGRFPRPARIGWGWRPTTGLRPVPGGGSAPATLENHFLEVVTWESAASSRWSGPNCRVASSIENQKTLRTETPFTQNT